MAAIYLPHPVFLYVPSPSVLLGVSVSPYDPCHACEGRYPDKQKAGTQKAGYGGKWAAGVE